MSLMLSLLWPSDAMFTDTNITSQTWENSCIFPSLSPLPRSQNVLVTFHVIVYCGYPHLCVCVCWSVCLSVPTCLQYCTDTDVTWGVVGNAH